MVRPLQPKPKPESELAHYRLLAPTASVRVSPLCFGSMNLGTAWLESMGSMDRETGFKMLDYFYDQGGNFIDTANNYQDEESETWIGEWMEKRNNRTRMVIATKFSTIYKEHEDGVLINFSGNSIKSLHDSVAASLKKLKTDYIDLLYLHWYDYTMSVEELMQGLDVLVKQGKVLYLGISDSPAWVVAKCNQYARDHGMRQFSVYQGKYSISSRDLEREVLPMLRAEGMALCPWASLGQGHYKTPEQVEEMKKNQETGRDFFPPTKIDMAIGKVLAKIGKELSVPPTSVALAYAMQKQPYIFPIVGGRKVSHLEENIKAINMRLSDEHIKELESTYEFDLGFPQTMSPQNPYDNFLLKASGYTDYVAPQKALPHH